MRLLVVAVAGAAMVMIALAVPARAVEAGPTVTLNKAVVSSKQLPDGEQVIAAGVTVAGVAPFTWSGWLSYRTGPDTRASRQLVGDAPLPAGASTLRLGDTVGKTYPTSVMFEITVVDANGATATTSLKVAAIEKTTRPTVSFVGRNATKKGMYIVWGKALVSANPSKYRVYLKARGKKNYRLIGSVRGLPNGSWSLTSPKLKPGRLYVETDSRFAKRKKSKVVKITVADLSRIDSSGRP